MKQRLDQRQVQKLILAPALQQAIKLLPMTNLELIEVIDEELSDNPMLELEEETVDKKPESEIEPEAGGAEAAAAPGGDKTPDAGPSDVDALPENPEDKEFESYFQEYFDDGFRASPQERPEVPSLENTLSKSTSLWDHLSWQANLTFFEPVEQDVAERIIGNINEDGYLILPPEEIARASGAPLATVEKVRAQIKIFDPLGCGSLDLRECLLVQMDQLLIGQNHKNGPVKIPGFLKPPAPEKFQRLFLIGRQKSVRFDFLVSLNIQRFFLPGHRRDISKGTQNFFSQSLSVNLRHQFFIERSQVGRIQNSILQLLFTQWPFIPLGALDFFLFLQIDPQVLTDQR